MTWKPRKEGDEGMRITEGFVGGLVCLVGLAGCVGSTGVQVSPRYMSSYTTDDVRYAAKEGVRAEIVGNPFAAEAQDQLEAVITESIAHDHFGPTLPVYTEPPEDFISPYRVVMVFNPTTRSYPLCEDTPEAGPNDGTVRVAAAFCASDRSLTEVKGSASDVQGPDDPRFRELISTMTLELFPPFDERDDNEPDADFDLN